MAGQPVPDDEQAPPQMALQVLQELNDLRCLDGPREELEVEVPPGDPGHHRQRLPAEVVLQHGRLPARCPSTIAARALTQSAFIDEDDGLSLSDGVFLAPASARASTAEWPSRRAPMHDPPAA